jgi:phage terminase large subunit-like protein
LSTTSNKSRTGSPVSRRRTSSRPVELADPAGLEGFADFCDGLTLEDKSPFVLHEFQQRMFGDYFDGVTETLILIPKKNGKTTSLAALALHHLLVTPDAECVIAAASRDQAQILLNQARGFVRRSSLSRYMTVKQREIVSLRDDGRVRVMASDSETADGVIPTLAIVDELHRHKDKGAMYGVFHDGLGPRAGRIITISTAGEDVDSPLGKLRQAAHALKVERDGAYHYARSADFAMHEWALSPEDDRSSMEMVKRANPAPWQTVDALTRRFQSPSMTGPRWARFACGVWVQGEASWIDAESWDACEGDVDLRDVPVVVGVDIGRKKDSTAVVAAGMVDGKMHVKARVLTPEPGRPIAVADARAAVLEFARELDVTEVVYDPHQFQESAELLEEQGLVLVELPQTDARMAPASESLYELIRDKRLVQDGDPVLRSHMLAAVPAETERGVRISKRKSKAQIDAAVASAMACSRALFAEPAQDFHFEVFT